MRPPLPSFFFFSTILSFQIEKSFSFDLHPNSKGSRYSNNPLSLKLSLLNPLGINPRPPSPRFIQPENTPSPPTQRPHFFFPLFLFFCDISVVVESFFGGCRPYWFCDCFPSLFGPIGAFPSLVGFFFDGLRSGLDSFFPYDHSQNPGPFLLPRAFSCPLSTNLLLPVPSPFFDP